MRYECCQSTEIFDKVSFFVQGPTSGQKSFGFITLRRNKTLKPYHFSPKNLFIEDHGHSWLKNRQE